MPARNHVGRVAEQVVVRQSGDARPRWGAKFASSRAARARAAQIWPKCAPKHRRPLRARASIQRDDLAQRQTCSDATGFEVSLASRTTQATSPPGRGVFEDAGRRRNLNCGVTSSLRVSRVWLTRFPPLPQRSKVNFASGVRRQITARDDARLRSSGFAARPCGWRHPLSETYVDPFARCNVWRRAGPPARLGDRYRLWVCAVCRGRDRPFRTGRDLCADAQSLAHIGAPTSYEPPAHVDEWLSFRAQRLWRSDAAPSATSSMQRLRGRGYAVPEHFLTALRARFPR